MSPINSNRPVQPLAHELEQIGARPDVAAAIERDVLARYDDEARTYHNRVHVLDTLQTAAWLSHHAPGQQREIRLALWFHDAIYDSERSDNEARSAELAAACLQRCSAPVNLIADVGDLIMATKTHDTASAASEVVVDADLAILGRSHALYAAYAQAIRQEYSWVSEAAYRQGRQAVLASFLNRPQIYHTAQMLETYESAARANLRWELNQLS